MNWDDIRLGSVNWEHGMLLAPKHFVRQEQYLDSLVLWVLRYASNAYGLVGGGPRLLDSERGAVRHDPVLVIDDDVDTLGLSVTQCRGLTPSGAIIEIDPRHPLQCRIPKADLEGVAESPIYIVCDPHNKQPVDGEDDEFNPQMKTERRWAYSLTLKPPADSIPYSLVVARLRRQKYGSGFERDPEFIPACTSLCSYSELIAAWRKIVDSVNLLSDRYTALHQAMREFLVLFAERGIDTTADVETMRFVDRMVAALQDCTYAILDPIQPPQRFFVSLRQFIHTAAVYLQLTPAVQQYFDALKQTGETEFITPLEQQKQVFNSLPRWDMQSDLGVEVRSALQSLDALRRLERALEGKYIDFRVSPSLEAMNFIFDRGGQVLYRLSSKPARVQGVGEELILYFSQLRLEGRDKYRLIVVGEQNGSFEPGSKIAVEIRINEGSGFRRAPVILASQVKNGEQRNFEFDFDAPDVPTITDLKVSLQAHLPVRTGLLFIRHRFYASRAEGPPRPVEPVAVSSEVSQVRNPDPLRNDSPPQRRSRLDPVPSPRTSRVDPSGEAASPQDNPAPWENPPQPPRRRRLG